MSGEVVQRFFYGRMFSGFAGIVGRIPTVKVTRWTRARCGSAGKYTTVTISGRAGEADARQVTTLSDQPDRELRWLLTGTVETNGNLWPLPIIELQRGCQRTSIGPKARRGIL